MSGDWDSDFLSQSWDMGLRRLIHTPTHIRFLNGGFTYAKTYTVHTYSHAYIMDACVCAYKRLKSKNAKLIYTEQVHQKPNG